MRPRCTNDFRHASHEVDQVAAKTALQDNASEFLEQTLTRLISSGKCNDNVVQRVRKTFEAFEEFNKLCVEAENQVTRYALEHDTDPVC